jgi:hypothetical protein
MKYIYTKQEQFIKEDLRYNLAGYKHDKKPIKLDTVYHVTSSLNIDSILSKGLNKNKPNSNEPEAIYLTPDIYGAVLLTKLLSKSKNQKTDWFILEINSKDLNLFRDPFAVKESGVYTYDNIPNTLIKIKTIVDAEILRSFTNWKLLWDWWFWHKGEKPTFVKKFNLEQYR